jgi:subtilisin-like proprotein convertase family protein
MKYSSFEHQLRGLHGIGGDDSDARSPFGDDGSPGELGDAMRLALLQEEAQHLASHAAPPPTQGAAESAPTGPSSDAVTLPTDGYFPLEWHLTGQAGIDVVPAWSDYTGRGIKIGIVDDGVDYKHVDLAARYNINLDYDSRDHDADAFASASDDNHGTAVAGVIAADRNGTGTVGVAYGATIDGFRIGFGANGTTAQIADALSRQTTMDVTNDSWGFSTPFGDNFRSSFFSASAQALANDAALGRGGLGTDIVFAAGNGRAQGDNVNYHNFQNSPFTIAVAATDINGKIASFSTPGAAVLVSAPGVGIVTTDKTGAAGFVNGDYVSVSGTSFAAPAVAGVIALMLEANPNLGYRDVQQILAYSSRETDPTNAGWKIDGAHDWNGGGLHFSQDFGFGLVDAAAAVRLAESWTQQSTFKNLVTQSATHVDNAAIPDGRSLSSHIVLGSAETIDKMQVDLSISHPAVQDLTVTLTSPNGTTATLISHPSSGTGGGIVFTTTANNFWGEDAKGDWTLTVSDGTLGNTGKLNGWTLSALGDAPTADNTYVYTNEYASFSGGSRGVLADAAGSDTLDLAAVTTNTLLDMRAGAISTVAGKALQIAAGTQIENAWLGDGNDVVTGNDVANIIHGGRGNDTIIGGLGADTLYGGAGKDLFVYRSLAEKGDVIKDFTIGDDILDLRQLMTSIGYRGADPVADKLLAFAKDGADATDVMIDLDGNGPQAAQKLVMLEHVLPTALHKTDYFV